MGLFTNKKQELPTATQHRTQFQKGRFDIIGMIKDKNIFNNRHRAYVITMYMRNSSIETLWVVTPDSQPLFNYMDGTYIIDEGSARYDTVSRTYHLVYHQDISVPLTIKHDVDAWRKKIDDKKLHKMDFDNIDQLKMFLLDGEYASWNINPIILNRVVESNAILKVIQGEAMTDIFTFIRNSLIWMLIMCGIIVIGVLATLVIVLGFT